MDEIPTSLMIKIPHHTTKCKKFSLDEDLRIAVENNG